MISRDYLKAYTHQHKLYASCGVPMAYWKGEPDFSSIQFVPILSKDRQKTLLGKKEQKDLFQSFLSLESLAKLSGVYAVCSEPTDDEALHLLMNLSKHLSKTVRNRVINIATYNPFEQSKEQSAFWNGDEASVFIVYNVFADATNNRLQAVRDFLHEYESKVVFLCVAGNPIDFMLNRLRYKPNGYLYINDSNVHEDQHSIVRRTVRSVLASGRCYGSSWSRPHDIHYPATGAHRKTSVPQR